MYCSHMLVYIVFYLKNVYPVHTRLGLCNIYNGAIFMLTEMNIDVKMACEVG